MAIAIISILCFQIFKSLQVIPAQLTYVDINPSSFKQQPKSMLNILELDDGHDRVEYAQLNYKPCDQKKETEQTSNLWMDIDHTNGRVSQLCICMFSVV